MYLSTIAESYVQINCSLSLSVTLSLSATGGCETSKELPPPPCLRKFTDQPSSRGARQSQAKETTSVDFDQSRDKDESDTSNSNQLSYSRTLTNGPDNKDSKFCMFNSA